MGRQGKVDELAATCLFLVSDDGGFITGQTIHVNGGAGYYWNLRRHRCVDILGVHRSVASEASKRSRFEAGHGSAWRS